MADGAGLRQPGGTSPSLIGPCDPAHPATRFLIRKRLYSAAARSKHRLIFSLPCSKTPSALNPRPRNA